MNDPLMKKSIFLGSGLGLFFGGLLGAGLGAITQTMNGILVGLAAGVGLGLLTGAATGALTARVAGTTGGVSFGAYAGMGLGALIGGVIGMLIPTSLRMSANTQDLPVLDALTLSRFEVMVFFGFFLCILGTLVGAWVSGRNFIPRKIEKQ